MNNQVTKTTIDFLFDAAHHYDLENQMEPKFYLHMKNATCDTQEDMGWVKVDPRGWWKSKFKSSTPFDSEEAAKAALRLPVFTGVDGSMMVVAIWIQIVSEVK